MMRAYSEYYLNDAKNTLATALDHAVNAHKLNADVFASMFVQTGYAEQFERGNPAILSGKSGIELCNAITNKVYRVQAKTLSAEPFDSRSPEYWAGWVLAEYQWFTGRRFRDIFSRISMSSIINMYVPYHEMDITTFINDMEKKYSAASKKTNLNKLRENRNLSQSELAELSGVSLRSIQMYEQKRNEIDKAQSHTLYKLSRVLGCDMEDLLENPNQFS